METPRVIVAGGRDFADRELMRDSMNTLWGEIGRYTVVSGGARGADSLGEEIASAAHIHIDLFPADWDRFGRSAGYRRNEQMALHSTHLLAFWDGKSRGTGHMIDLAHKHGLTVKIVRY